MLNKISAQMPQISEITVSVKSVYGKETIYPICQIAHHFCSMLGQKTLTRDNIMWIKLMGFVVKAEVTPITI
jgi:hypothetical protein